VSVSAGLCHVRGCVAYLLCQIVQLFPSIIDEPVDDKNLLAVNSRLLQLGHQRRNVLDLLVDRSHIAAVLPTHRPQCAGAG
jgi:hypothetical protein